jgi:asparagine synthase (glutamine-hydrolysing)
VSAIAGLWRFDEKPQVAADCAAMLSALQIYGPHRGSQWSDGPLAMGRRLFVTLPEDIHDDQPLHSRDGRLTLVADVRLDNRDELIAGLRLPSSDSAHFCDAAILLASLERWGEAALDRLVGNFAFALWEAATRKLTLARDFLGRRPLHYHCGRGFFAFASMAKGLHALGEVPYGPDEQSVAELVTLMPQWGSRSFFKDISRVQPAHIVTVTREGVSSRRYWQPQRPQSGRPAADDHVEGLRHHLDMATLSRLRGVNDLVASQLSAGLDSGAVTTTAARLLAPRGGRVVAFTAVPRKGYDGPELRNRLADEGPLAAMTAALCPNIEHVLIRPPRFFSLDALDRYFSLSERPILTMGNLGWSEEIGHAARERKIGVMLVGWMGNATVSYNGNELLAELLQRGRLIKLWHETSQLTAKTGMHWRGALLRTFGPFTPVWLWQLLHETFRGHKMEVLEYTAIRAERLAELNLPALARERALDFSYRPRKDGFETRCWMMSRSDGGTGIKGALAGWSIDYRDPMSDKRLVEYCLRIPTEEYLANGTPRALARRALADRLPQAVLNERKRGYQGADWHEGLTAARTEVAAELDRLAACAPAAKLLDIDRLKRLVENWPTSGWERDEVIESYRLALLRGIAAGHFLRKASGANQ